MRNLEDVNNTDPISSDYPHGKVRDKSLTDSGTSVTESLIGDLITTLEKIKSESKISANHLPDNETNGYQLLEALFATFQKNIGVSDSITLDDPNTLATSAAVFKAGGAGIPQVRTAYIYIGVWDMRTDASKIISNNTFKTYKVLGVQAFVNQDLRYGVKPIDYEYANKPSGSISYNNNGTFSLLRTSDGRFKVDENNYQGSGNRGYILVHYID